MDDNKQGNKVKKLVILTILIIIVIPTILFIWTHWGVNIFGGSFVLGQTCINYHGGIISCGQNIRYVGNGRILVEVARNASQLFYAANQTLYNVRFACTGNPGNGTTLNYTSRVIENGSIVNNNTFQKGTFAIANVTCFENGSPISTTSNGGLYFSGTLWANYTLSSNVYGPHIYVAIGTITLGIKKVGGI